MGRALDRAVAIFTDQETTDATAWDWSQITVDQVRKLRSVMVAGNAAAGTVNHVLSGVRSTVRIAWALDLVDLKTRIEIEDEPNEKLPPQRQSSGRYVRRDEVRQLFAVLGTDEIGSRDAAMLALLYGAGLKRSEAAELQLAHYDEETGAITVRPGERDQRQVYATNGGKEAIDVWIATATTGRGPCCARSPREARSGSRP
jgi:site-specific recombinase XerC